MEAAIRLWLVRHGETLDNHRQTIQGQHPRLGRISPKGLAQARAVGRALANTPLDGVFCSPLERAVMTLTGILAQRPGDQTLPLAFLDDLKEIDMGGLAGLPRQEYHDRAGSRPAGFKAPGGESWLDVQHRAGACLRQEMAERKYRAVLMVSHAGVNRGLIASLLGYNITELWVPPDKDLPQTNGCINRIELDARGRVISAVINDTIHLTGAAAPDKPSPCLIWNLTRRRFEPQS
ncbi:MAG: histidine phosphatase family protein [Deltaproteobacteria bacterium]|nr:histidine phosphatase family protein [Deltaproteobacteria bacterium]